MAREWFGMEPTRHPIRIDAERFDDLAPLAQALKGVDLLQLGEATHGAAQFYTLKSRIVRFLHERAGFDTLLLESGFLEATLAGLDRPRHAAATMMEETAFVNFRWQEMLPLYERIAARPQLHFAGIDPQFTSDSLLDRVRSAVSPYDSVLAEELKKNLGGCYALFGQTQDRAKFDATRDGYFAWLETTRAALGKIVPKREDRERWDVLTRGLSVLKPYWNVPPDGLFGPDRNALRDRIMADHAAWLLARRRRPRAILWAHNGHIGDVPWYPTTGHHLAKSRGRRSYALGVFAVEGTFYSHMTRKVEPWAAPDGGLERRLAGGDAPAVFVDFRSQSPEALAEFRKPMPAFEPENGGVFAFNAADRFDGVLLVRRISPPNRPKA